MDPKKKFNMLIETIEKFVSSDELLSASEIADRSARSLARNVRDIDSAFAFLTGRSLNSYIRERKMMMAYKLLLSAPALGIDRAVDISGYDNQSSFTKEFKRRFGIKPGDASVRGDRSKLKPPLDWDGLLSVPNDQNVPDEQEVEKDEEEILFGIPEERFSLIMKASDLKSFYGFSNLKSNIAFEIAEEFAVPLDCAFEFVCSVCDYYRSDDEETLDDGIFCAIIPHIVRLAYICFNVGIPVDEADALQREAEMYGIDLSDIDAEYLKYFCRTDMLLKKFIYYVERFEELGGTYFEGYIDNIECGLSPEKAVEHEEVDISGFDMSLEFDDDIVFASQGYQQWEEELTEGTGEDIDPDYDEDNPFYGKSDDYDY